MATFRCFVEGVHPDTERILQALESHPEGLTPFQLAEMVWDSKPGDREKALSMDQILQNLWEKDQIGLQVRKIYFPLNS